MGATLAGQSADWGAAWAAWTAYAAAWAGFGAVHSLLAGARVKALLRPWVGRGYRLAYNLLALLQLALVMLAGQRLLGGAPAFALPPALRWLMLAVHLAGWAGLLWSARSYDLGRLAGIAQLRHPEAPEDEPLRLAGPHRWVRHPLYAWAMVVLWSAAVDRLGLATALWASLYLVIGSRFEERRLLALYGEAYASYRRRVPAFLPLRRPHEGDAPGDETPGGETPGHAE